MHHLSTVQSKLIEKVSKPNRFIKKYGPVRVVVIGAGLSRAFGLPLASELLFKLVEWHRSRPSAHRLDEIFEFIEYFYPAFNRASCVTSDYPDCEDLLGMLDTALIYGGLRKAGRGNRWRSGRIDTIRSNFARLLGEYLWSFQTSLTVDAIQPLRTLVKTFGPRTVYVSFNYDLLLETALSLEGLSYTYSIDLAVADTGLLKPHGSVNWFVPLNLVKAPSFKNAWSLGPNVLVHQTLDPVTFQFKNGWKEPVIVPPTPTKQISIEELRKTWAQFSSAIHTTPRLIAIGYSMPSADRLARLVIRKAGPRHSHSRKIAVVNPNPKVCATYTQLISPRVKSHTCNFEQWVADGMPE